MSMTTSRTTSAPTTICGRRKRLPLWIAALLFSLALVACGNDGVGDTERSETSGDEAGATGESGEDIPETVRIGVGGGFSFTYLPTYVAIGEGFLKEELDTVGSSLEIENFVGSVEATNALVNDDVQYISSVTSTMLNAIASGAQIRQLAQFYSTDIVVLLAREGVPFEPDQLVGTRWGITSFGANNHVSALKVAEFLGLAESDIELIAVGPPSAYEAAIESEQIDLVFAGEPAAENLLISGRANLVIDLFDPENVEEVYGGPYATSGLQGSAAFVDGHPTLNTAMVRAHVRALEFIQENLDDPERITQALPEEMQSENIVAIVERITAGLSEDGMVHSESIERVIDAGRAAGLMEDPDFQFDLDAIIDNSYR